MTSDVQTITVKDVVITVSIDDDAYAVTKYSEINEADPVGITIVKPSVEVSGADKGNDIDRKESTVQITRTSGSSTTTLATITLEEWEEHFADDKNNRNFDIQGSTIKLLLRDNGTYTIKYSIQAVDHLGQKVGDPEVLEYSISNGDVTAPTVELSDDFVKSTYKLGDTLVLNMAGVEVEDNTTDVESLLKTMKVTLTNTDTEESWTLESDPNASEGTYIYEHKFESAGNYTLTITVEDEAGISGSSSVSFTVSTEDTEPINVTEVLGGVLIGLSVALLAGVVIYFIVSKVKLDKKEKTYKAKISKKDESKEDYKKNITNDILKLENKLKRECNISPSIFAYPFGEYNDDCEQILRELGYKAFLTCNEGINIIKKGEKSKLSHLKRINRTGQLTTTQFFEKLI